MNDGTQQKVLMVFFEGLHDAAFIHLILTKKMGGEEKPMAYSNYPEPLPGLFKQAQIRLFAGNSKTYNEMFPYATYVYQNWLIILFNMDGCDLKPKMQTAIRNFYKVWKTNLSTGSTTGVISDLRFAFEFDADELGFDGRCGTWLQNFGTIKDCNDWRIPDCTESDDYWKIHGDKGVFVWRGNNPTGKGTLEDITSEILEKFTGFPVKASGEFRDAMEAAGTWTWNEASNEEKQVAQKAEKLKMAITIAGQKCKPGAALHTIIKESYSTGAIEHEQKNFFLNAPVVCAFQTFINKLLNLRVPDLGEKESVVVPSCDF